ncbi:phage/plasmid replication domain-containing protein [Pseudomonas syringae]|uniref:phage/plasmid replication domain-containing protein n=1 Tax=Pseudomonas syringae TaxID=317 RepID=UPI000A9CDF5C|nr:phage/plasmid replication protein [Pseudomonas syringae]
MMIDWLTVSQDHDHDLPVVCDVFTLTIDSNTNEVLSTRQPRFKHEASHSTSVTIHVQGRKVRVEGNPSRVGRLDNLFGYTSVEQCISVYNALLREYGLPAFTRCTRLELRQGASGAKSSDLVADGAKIERIDLTTNIALGEGNVLVPMAPRLNEST